MVAIHRAQSVTCRNAFGQACTTLTFLDLAQAKPTSATHDVIPATSRTPTLAGPEASARYEPVPYLPTSRRDSARNPSAGPRFSTDTKWREA